MFSNPIRKCCNLDWTLKYRKYNALAFPEASKITLILSIKGCHIFLESLDLRDEFDRK